MLLAHSEEMPKYRRKQQKKHDVSIEIVGDYSDSDFLDFLVKQKGKMFARHITILPNNYLTLKIYIKILEYMAQGKNWQCRLV